jgi:hypothetical protein
VQLNLADLLQPPLVQQLYQQSRLPQISTATPVPQMTGATIVDYFQGMKQAALIQQHAVTEKTKKARLTALREYNNWLLQHVQIRDVNTCIPEDFLVYFTQHWMLHHSGSSSGLRIAPTSVNSLISNLSREMDGLGREGPWDSGKGKFILSHPLFAVCPS